MGLLEEQNDSFVELNMQERSQVLSPVKKGNVVKAFQGEAPATSPSQSTSSQNQEPEVIVHQSGNKIESIEFRCPCGRHTDVKIEYDGD